MRKVSTLIPAQQKALIEYVTDLLARCESGDVIAVTAIEQLPGGNYAIRGNRTASRHETAGMLLDAAITRLRDDDE